MAKEKQIKTTTVSYETFHSEGFKAPSKWYIYNALGEYFFIHVKERSEAQSYINGFYGRKQYTVHAIGEEKGTGNITCKATTNSVSRRGNNFLKMKDNYGSGRD